MIQLVETDAVGTVAAGKVSRTLCCAVVGLGRIAWAYHIPQILKQPGFSLVAVVDPSPERRREAVAAFGVAETFDHCEQLLRRKRPDLMVIASPTAFHAEQVILSMKSGCDVFCDKPIAMNYAEAESMFETAARLGRKLMVFQPHRLSAEAVTAGDIIRSDKLGPLYLIRRTADSYSRRDDWQAFLRHGGGMLLNYGSHYLDQLFYLTGSCCRRAKCELRRIISLGDAEDVVKILLTTDRDILFDLDINQAASLSAPSWVIYGRHGTAVLEPGNRWHLKYFRPEMIPEKMVSTVLAAPGRKYPEENIPWIEENLAGAKQDDDVYYRKCYDYFALDRKPLVSPEETLELMRTIELCRKNNLENK